MQTSNNDSVKIHAFMAQQGVASRRAAEELVAEGKVLVNGEKAHVGQRIDPAKDTVEFDGKVIGGQVTLEYYLINKPPGLISTTADELNRQTVLSLVPKTSARLYPVGRLDKDSEGLMLLTNDGVLTDKLTHPRYGVSKTYEVLVPGRPTTKALEHLRRGVRLKEGYTQPAEVEVIDHTDDGNTWVSITIKEGRNHQVRRMLERVGYDTLKLIRVKLGPFSLDDLDGERVRVLSGDTIKKYISTNLDLN